MLDQEYDFIIVGQGLAGTCLAAELLNHGQKILVVDAPSMPSASVVAGGIFNPITGRKMVLTWKAHQLFPFLQHYYKQLEIELGGSFLHNLPLFRPFATKEEMNEWQGRSEDSRYKPFIESITSKPVHSDFVKNDLGGVFLRNTGYLDTKSLLNKFKGYLRERNMLLEEEFIVENINFQVNSVVYKEYLASKIILCGGPSGFGSELLKNIRFHPLKGEVLSLKINFESDFMVNRNVFVLPRNGHFIAGSNYDLDGRDWHPTEAARDEISAKLDSLLNKEYEIIDQKAGIRPTTHDRRPVLGLLPKHPQIGVFNGLGTKGVSLAPYFAHQFANYLVKSGEIEEEVNIGRFFS